MPEGVNAILSTVSTITTPIALVAFLAAIALFALQIRVKGDNDRLGKLAQKDRFTDEDLRTFERLTSGSFGEGLSSQQKFEIIKSQAEIRERINARRSWYLIVLYIIFGSVGLIALAIGTGLMDRFLVSIRPPGVSVSNSDLCGPSSLIGINGIASIEPDANKRPELWARICGREPPPEIRIILVSMRVADSQDSQSTTEAQHFRAEDVRKIAIEQRDLCLSSMQLSTRSGRLYCAGKDRAIETQNLGGKIDPKLVVIHFTATSSFEGTVKWLTKPEANASAHIVVDRNGSYIQLVPFDRKAWHAGLSEWKEYKNLNDYSIGIELINLGKLSRQENGKYFSWNGRQIPDDEVMVVTEGGERTYWHRFTEPQLAAVEAISREISRTYKIDDIVGHCEIAPKTKIDPGPAFPLSRLGETVLGHPPRQVNCRLKI